MELSHSVRSFLDSQPVGHLATVDADSEPHVVPVCFARLDDQIVMAIDAKPKSTRRLKRLRNIELNPRVALVVDVYEADWSRLRWVMLRGAAVVESAGTDTGPAIAALRAKYPQYRAMELTGNPLIRLRPERVHEWSASRVGP